MNKILTSFQFLTKLPIKVKDFKEGLLAESTVYFPLVGLFLGLCLMGLEMGLSQFLPITIIAIIQVIFLAVITGGLHIDGFADTFDGLGCNKTSQQKLQVMKDSRVGVMGALSIVLLVLIKYNSLSLIDQDFKISCLLIFPILSRWSMALMIFMSSQESHIGLASKFQNKINVKHLLLASLPTFLLVLYLLNIFGTALLALVVVVVIMSYKLLLKEFGKVTGDHFGFLNETVEVLVLLVFLVYGYS